MIKTFFLEPLFKVQQNLRCYTRDGGECAVNTNYGYHNASVTIGVTDVPDLGPDPDSPGDRLYHELEIGTSCHENGKIGPIAVDDPRWPKACACGYVFKDTEKQYRPHRLYRRLDTGEEMTLEAAPVGAMWHTDYTGHTGPDGKCLVVKIPNKNHQWMVDSRASNCDSPCQFCRVPYHSHKNDACPNPGNPEYPFTKGNYVDSRPEHRCWVRHGDPSKGEIVHVDKAGITCNAGAGSIIAPDGWHGFLHNGHLTGC